MYNINIKLGKAFLELKCSIQLDIVQSYKLCFVCKHVQYIVFKLLYIIMCVCVCFSLPIGDHIL